MATSIDTAEQNITIRGPETDIQMSAQIFSQENVPIVAPSPDISYAMDVEEDKSPPPVNQQTLYQRFQCPRPKHKHGQSQISLMINQRSPTQIPKAMQISKVVSAKAM